MKKSKKTIISAACALLALLTTACSNDDVVDGNKNGQIDANKNIEFSLKFDDYNAEDTIDHATRAAQDAELAKPRIIPMGDMMYAEVSMQRDTTKATPKEKAAATRALSDGTYTIYAYQGTTLKGTLTGTVTSNVFTPTSSNQEIYLEPGTYTFVCCNDKVQISGETWTIDRADAETARIGIAAGKVVTATPRKQKVAFEMKHVGSRARIKLQAEGFPMLDITSTLTSTSNIVGSVKFNPATQSYINSSTESLSVLPDFSNYNYSGYTNYMIDGFSKYLYFLPGTTGSQLKLTLTGGTAYRLPVAGRTVSFPSLSSMVANGSYILRLVLRYNYIYLYSDGTTGQITDADHFSKTPIGVVVSRSKRLAVALKDARNEVPTPFGASTFPWSAHSLQNSQSMTTMSNNIADHINDFKGEDYTWTSTYSTDGKVKANESTDYPAFYAAAHYSPGVPITGTNVGKWFLPTLGEWNLLSKNLNLELVDLRLGQPTEYNVIPGTPPSGYLPLEYGFYRANGDGFKYNSGPGNTDLNIPVLASEYDITNYITPPVYSENITYLYTIFYKALIARLVKKSNPDQAAFIGPFYSIRYFVRPFVHY